MTNRLIQFFAILIGSFIISILVIDLSFNFVNQPVFFESGNKIWSHRGIVHTSKQQRNSIEAIENALLSDYPGVELDLWLIGNQLRIAHDKEQTPQSAEFSELTALAEKFPEGRFWFDLKNLHQNTAEQILRILDTAPWVKSRCIIESKNAIALSMLNNRGYATCLWLRSAQQNRGVIDRLRFGLLWMKEKLMISIHSYNAISLSGSEYLQEKQLYRLKGLNVHLWLEPENTPEEEQLLLKDEQVKIFLKD